MPKGSIQKQICEPGRDTKIPETVLEVLAVLARDPVRALLLKWNWKAALLSACLRGSIFFWANLGASLEAAVGAMLAEFIFRTITSGFYGSFIQSFRCVRPAWKATLATVGVVPLVSHTIEFLIHYLRGTEKLALSILCSVSFTALSISFNLFAMRRGALVVDDESDSLVQDLRRLPGILIEFCRILVSVPLLWIRRRLVLITCGTIPVKVMTGSENAQKTTCSD
jgi:hypothetical protein